MTAPNQSNRERYEWDACTGETDMIETLEPEFAVIWLRRQAYRWHLYDWDALTQAYTDMTEKSQFLILIFKRNSVSSV